MLDKDPTIGHRLDRSFEQINEALNEAVLLGDEAKIMALQQEARMRFGNLF